LLLGQSCRELAFLTHETVALGLYLRDLTGKNVRHFQDLTGLEPSRISNAVETYQFLGWQVKNTSNLAERLARSQAILKEFFLPLVIRRGRVLTINRCPPNGQRNQCPQNPTPRSPAYHNRPPLS